MTSCLDASLLELAYCSNSSLQRFHRFVYSSIHPHTSSSIASTLSSLPNPPTPPHRTIKPHFTHLLIDEAAQATEPELAIPISVVLPDLKTIELSELPQILICGDMKQLGPNVISALTRTLDLDVSLLQRLLERDAYSLLITKQQQKANTRQQFLAPRENHSPHAHPPFSPSSHFNAFRRTSPENSRTIGKFPVNVPPMTPESPKNLDDPEEAILGCDHVVNVRASAICFRARFFLHLCVCDLTELSLIHPPINMVGTD